MQKPTNVGFVYVFKCADRYKIGSSRDPRERLKAIQTASPVTVEMYHQIESVKYKYIERDLHKLFAKKRVSGEWFTLNDDDLNYIKSLDERGRNPIADDVAQEYWDRVSAAVIWEMKRRRLGKFAEIPPNEYVPRVEYF